ncbi:MAG: phytanoyl-CoA dioxygenase family protein [Desmonostoc vinosum HA7617-LM4]|nr:phytanoyl-CoA dioxygenase family protein [Desmonostoc vinosum HA7617-LM4]
MQNLNLTETSISFQQTKSIPANKIAERILHGEVVIIRKCLQKIGYFECLQKASLEGIQQAVGQEKATRIKNQGFEAVHKIIDLNELSDVSDRTYEVIRSLAPAFSKALVKEVFQTQKPFYFEKEPNVRFHIPYDIVVKRKQEFSKFYWNGKITPHGPHHDSWYQCPTNSINIWIAMGTVTIGNGLNIYPQVHNKRLPCTPEGKIPHNQYFESALNFHLEPGDALIFHGEHLHSSEINSTDATRYVISLRLTLDKPNFLESSPYRYDYIYSECNDSFKAKCTELIVNTSRQMLKKINTILPKQNQNYIISPNAVCGFDDTSTDFPKPIPVESTEDIKLAFDSQELPIGKIRPVSPKICVARLDNNQVVAFSRYCPHEGADLAGGYLRDQCIVCPWHNLPISTESGASPCQSLSKLTIFNCTEDNNQVEVQS